MKMTIESTEQIVAIEQHGRTFEARRWTGRTDSGIEVDVFVPVIRVRSTYDQSQFAAELRELPQPSLPPIPMKFLV